MGIKKGCPLDNVQELSQELKERCHKQGYSTAEEFVGLAWAAPQEFADFLGIEMEELERLTEIMTSAYIEREYLEQMRDIQTKEYALGALDPKTAPKIEWEA